MSASTPAGRRHKAIRPTIVRADRAAIMLNEATTLRKARTRTVDIEDTGAMSMPAMLARKPGSEWHTPYRVAMAPARSLTGLDIAIAAGLSSLGMTVAEAIPTMAGRVFTARGRITARSANTPNTLRMVRGTILPATTAAHVTTVMLNSEASTGTQATFKGSPVTMALTFGTRTMVASAVVGRPGIGNPVGAMAALAITAAPGFTT